MIHLLTTITSSAYLNPHQLALNFRHLHLAIIALPRQQSSVNRVLVHRDTASWFAVNSHEPVMQAPLTA